MKPLSPNQDFDSLDKEKLKSAFFELNM